jgi:hypothetical protein
MGKHDAANARCQRQSQDGRTVYAHVLPSQSALGRVRAERQYKQHRYGIAYLVECSIAPWAAVPTNANLYSYAPSFIKVSWRTVEIPKPNIHPNGIQAHLDNNINGFPIAMPPALPLSPPQRPNAITGACVPAGNNSGGPVFQYGGHNGVAYPAIQANGFDGEIEIHQN